jgi:hypothetical protein
MTEGLLMSQHVAPGPPAAPGAGAGFVLDARRWSGYEVAAGGLSLLLLALVSAPWFGIRFAGCPPRDGFACQVSVTGTVHGTVHGYMWATIVPALVILAMLVLRAGYDTVPFFRWPSDRQLLAGAACANLLIVVAAFLAKPGYIPLPNPRHLPVAPVPPPILAVSWGRLPDPGPSGRGGRRRHPQHSGRTGTASRPGCAGPHDQRPFAACVAAESSGTAEQAESIPAGLS